MVLIIPGEQSFKTLNVIENYVEVGNILYTEMVMRRVNSRLASWQGGGGFATCARGTRRGERVLPLLPTRPGESHYLLALSRVTNSHGSMAAALRIANRGRVPASQSLRRGNRGWSPHRLLRLVRRRIEGNVQQLNVP